MIEAQKVVHVAPGTYYITGRSTYRPRDAKGCTAFLPPRITPVSRSFLRLCNYYRIFIARFVDIAKLLTQLTEMKRTYKWSPETDTALWSLKVSLCTSSTVGYPRPGEKYIVTRTRGTLEFKMCCHNYRTARNE
jgi:hypothetical protein